MSTPPDPFPDEPDFDVDADRMDVEPDIDAEPTDDAAPPAAEADGAALFEVRDVEPRELVPALEAILFVVESPVSVAALATAVQAPTAAVQEALDMLRAGYDERGAGIELRDVAGAVRIYTRPEHAGAVEQFLVDGQRSKLSQAALETLAVVAYRQPVTRARVSAIRGVNVDGVVRSLLARGMIVEVGTDPDTGGGLFRTTDVFLERMGLQSLDELPSLAPLLPEIEGLDALGGDEF